MTQWGNGVGLSFDNVTVKNSTRNKLYALQ
jgi:hypothetical protein